MSTRARLQTNVCVCDRRQLAGERHKHSSLAARRIRHSIVHATRQARVPRASGGTAARMRLSARSSLSPRLSQRRTCPPPRLRSLPTLLRRPPALPPNERWRECPPQKPPRLHVVCFLTGTSVALKALPVRPNAAVASPPVASVARHVAVAPSGPEDAARCAALASRISRMWRSSRCMRVSSRCLGGWRREYSSDATRSRSSTARCAFSTPYGSPPCPVAGSHRGFPSRALCTGNSQREIPNGEACPRQDENHPPHPPQHLRVRGMRRRGGAQGSGARWWGESLPGGPHRVSARSSETSRAAARTWWSRGSRAPPPGSCNLECVRGARQLGASAERSCRQAAQGERRHAGARRRIRAHAGMDEDAPATPRDGSDSVPLRPDRRACANRISRAAASSPDLGSGSCSRRACSSSSRPCGSPACRAPSPPSPPASQPGSAHAHARTHVRQAGGRGRDSAGATSASTEAQGEAARTCGGMSERSKAFALRGKFTVRKLCPLVAIMAAAAPAPAPRAQATQSQTSHRDDCWK